MVCSSQYKPIVLAHQARLESERNGGPAVYWADAVDPSTFNGATTVIVYTDIVASYLATGGAFSVALVAQQSVDGVDWDIDSVVQLTAWTTTGKDTERITLSTRVEYGPYVRLGLQISNSNASTVQNMAQVAALISCTVVPLAGDNEVAALGGSVAASAATGDIDDSTFDTLGLTTLVLGVRASSLGGSTKTWTATLRGSFDGTNFYDLPSDVSGVLSTTGTFTLTDSSTLAVIIRCQTLPRYVKLRKTGGTADAGTVTFEIIGRGF